MYYALVIIKWPLNLQSPALLLSFTSRSVGSLETLWSDFSSSIYLKVWSTVKICGTRVLQKAIVPVGRPSPYSIIILNMRFIPKGSLRASSQITASSYILERHLWVYNSKLLALTPIWSLACKQTDCITAGMLKLLATSLYSHAGGLSLKHCTFIQCWFNVGPASQTLPSIKTALDQCPV